MCLSVGAFAQRSGGSVSYYPFNNVLAVSTNPDKAVWIETRLQMNSRTTSLTSELAPMITLSKREKASYYMGAGINVYLLKLFDKNANIINGYFLSTGVRAYPFEKAPKVGINFELSPYAYRDFDLGDFRAFLGLSYRFGK
jgi:hypothetical protein